MAVGHTLVHAGDLVFYPPVIIHGWLKSPINVGVDGKVI